MITNENISGTSKNVQATDTPPAPATLLNASEEELQFYIDKYKYLLKRSTVAYQKKWAAYSLMDQYKHLYHKYHSEKRKSMTLSSHIASTNKMSVVDYIASKLDVFELSYAELKKLSDVLPTLHNEVQIVLDLKNEEIEHLSEMKQQLQSLDSQRESLAKSIRSIEKYA